MKLVSFATNNPLFPVLESPLASSSAFNSATFSLPIGTPPILRSDILTPSPLEERDVALVWGAILRVVIWLSENSQKLLKPPFTAQAFHYI